MVGSELCERWLATRAQLEHCFHDDSKNNGSAQPATVTNIGVMPPGQQVNPVDQWVGTAGRKLAQYENERDEQTRLNKDRQAFEARTMQRFAELEQKLTSASQAASMSLAPNAAAASNTPAPPTMPPASSLPLPPPPASTAPQGRRREDPARLRPAIARR